MSYLSSFFISQLKLGILAVTHLNLLSQIKMVTWQHKLQSLAHMKCAPSLNVYLVSLNYEGNFLQENDS